MNSNPFSCDGKNPKDSRPPVLSMCHRYAFSLCVQNTKRVCFCLIVHFKINYPRKQNVGYTVFNYDPTKEAEPSFPFKEPCIIFGKSCGRLEGFESSTRLSSDPPLGLVGPVPPSPCLCASCFCSGVSNVGRVLYLPFWER